MRMRSGTQLRVAMLSLHSCPLGQPGTKDAGGMSVYIQQISRRLGARGIAVDIFTTHHQQESQDVMTPAENVRLIHLPLEWPHEAGKLGLYPYIQDLACAANDFKEKEGLAYHIVHSHYWLSCLAGRHLSGWWNIPHVVMLHTSARGKNRALGSEIEPQLREVGEKEALASASLVIAATDRENRDLADLYDVPSGKIAVIPCGVDLEMFHPVSRNEARSILGMDSATILLYVGRLETEKGIGLFMEAVSLMRNGRNLQVLIVGGGKGEEDKINSLRQKSHELGIDDLTHFQYAVAQSKLPLYYSAADLCVLPSRYETFGLVALEALACGTPVIASKVGVMAEAINTPAGILLDEPSPASLASTITGLLEDNASLKMMASQSRKAVVNLSWDRAAEKIIAEYKKLANF